MTIPASIIDMLRLTPTHVRGEIATAILARLLNHRAADRGQEPVSDHDSNLSPEARLHFQSISAFLDRHHDSLLRRRQRRAERAEQDITPSRPAVEPLAEARPIAEPTEKDQLVMTAENIDQLIDDTTLTDRQLIAALDRGARRLRTTQANAQLDLLATQIYGNRDLMRQALSVNPDITVIEYLKRLSLYRRAMNPRYERKPKITQAEIDAFRNYCNLNSAPLDRHTLAICRQADYHEEYRRQLRHNALINAPIPQQITFARYLHQTIHINPNQLLHKIRLKYHF